MTISQNQSSVWIVYKKKKSYKGIVMNTVCFLELFPEPVLHTPGSLRIHIVVFILLPIHYS